MVEASQVPPYVLVAVQERPRPRECGAGGWRDGDPGDVGRDGKGPILQERALADTSHLAASPENGAGALQR